MTTFWPKRDKDGRHITEPKPLSELLAKLDSDVVERARESVADELESGKLSYDCIYCLDTGIYVDAYNECFTCGCTE